MRDKVDVFMNLKGVLRDTGKGQFPQNPVEILMGDFVERFQETLKVACTDTEIGLTDINPRILIAMGLTNIIVNMILTFKDIDHPLESAKETLKMYDDLMKDVRTMAQNALGLLEANMAVITEEKHAN